MRGGLGVSRQGARAGNGAMEVSTELSLHALGAAVIRHKRQQT